MVSRGVRNRVRKALPAPISAHYSPLEKSPHNAAIVGDGAMPATGAFIEMTAKCSGTATLNGPQYFHVLPTKPAAVLFDERLSRGADDIGHLERWPAHLFLADGLVVDG